MSSREEIVQHIQASLNTLRLKRHVFRNAFSSVLMFVIVVTPNVSQRPS